MCLIGSTDRNVQVNGRIIDQCQTYIASKFLFQGIKVVMETCTPRGNHGTNMNACALHASLLHAQNERFSI